MNLSIIIPTYNSEKTISKAINSILKQKLDDFEIIIVDDASEDNTEKIIKEINNPNIRYYKLKNNTGVSHARNFGINMSIGKYIMFMDSDDIQIDNMSKILLDEISKKGNELVVCSYKRYDGNKEVTKKIQNKKLKELNEKSKFIELLYINNLLKSPCNKIYSRDIIISNNLKFDESKNLGEDYIFNLEYISLINKYEYIQDVLYIYNRNPKGLSLKKNKNRFKTKIYNWKIHYNLTQNYNQEYLFKDFIKIYFSGILACEDENDYKMFILNEDIINILKNNINQVNNIVTKTMFKRLIKIKKWQLKCINKIEKFIWTIKEKI